MLPEVTGEFRAAADSELRFTPSGMAIASVRAVASSRKKDDSTGEWSDDKTCWVKVIAFKRLAENMAESIVKGSLFTVTGRIQTDEWEDKEGVKRTTIEIVANTLGVSIAFDPVSGGGKKAERQSAGASSQEEGNPWDTGSGGTDQPEEPPF